MYFISFVHLQVVVFSWTRCPFCMNAKALLDSKGAKYTAVELDKMDDGNAIRAQLAEVSMQHYKIQKACQDSLTNLCASDDQPHQYAKHFHQGQELWWL